MIVIESDGTLRDNNWGHTGEFGGALGRLSNRSVDNIHERVHTAFPQIPTDNLNEWYFICATFNPDIDEDGSFQYIGNGVSSNDRHSFWMNNYHPVNQAATVNSGFGNKCKVEFISRTDLFRARGYRI